MICSERGDEYEIDDNDADDFDYNVFVEPKIRRNDLDDPNGADDESNGQNVDSNC